VLRRTGLDDTEKRKFLTLPGVNSVASVQPVASHSTDCAIQAPKKFTVVSLNNITQVSQRPWILIKSR
jgi:hypothetical protein